MMLLSNPHLQAATVTSPVETMQVAPTILQALGLNPQSLQSDLSAKFHPAMNRVLG
jgi:hypothetical protein